MPVPFPVPWGGHQRGAEPVWTQRDVCTSLSLQRAFPTAPSLRLGSEMTSARREMMLERERELERSLPPATEFQAAKKELQK